MAAQNKPAGMLPKQEEKMKPTKLTEKKLAAAVRLAEAAYVDCFLSEANCRRWFERNPNVNLEEGKTFSIEEIRIDEKVTKGRKQQLEKIFKEFEDVFAKNDDEPPIMKSEPVSFLLKEGAARKEAHCAQPTMGEHQKELLRQYRLRGMRQGYLRRSKSKHAGRIHMCLKTPKDEIRYAWDSRMINDLLAKLAPNLPNIEHQLHKQSGNKFFFSTDALKGYHQLALTPETSEMLAVWLDDGLYEPTRLTEGSKNAGVYYQAAVTRALNTLAKEVLKDVSNYADDFLVGAKTWEQFEKNVRAFLEMCRRERITLHPAKTKISVDRAKMVGHEIVDGKVVIHEDNLAPLKTAAEPENKTELRSFLGICNYARRHVKDFASIAAALTKLTGSVPWQWGDAERKAFKKLKEEVIKNFPLHVADYTKPFYLFSDASDIGMGAVLCQLDGDYADKDIGSVPDDKKRIIAFYSAAHDDAMVKRPIYYREMRAMIFGLEKARQHLERSQHQVICVTDHCPLQWVKNTNRGVVTSWLLEEAAEIDFRIVYIQGPTNKDADAMSRTPIVAPSTFNLQGTQMAIDALLRNLPSQAEEAKNVFVCAGSYTTAAAKTVQDWRKLRNAIKTGAPKALQRAGKIDLAIVIPAAEESPIVARQMIEERPETLKACLVQSDLVPFIPKIDGKEDESVRDTIKNASKITFLGANTTWLIFDGKQTERIISVEHPSELRNWISPNILLSREEPVVEILTDEDHETVDLQSFLNELEALSIPDLEEEELEKGKDDPKTDRRKRWLENLALEKETIQKYFGKQAKESDDGMIQIENADGHRRMYVPKLEREDLILEEHKKKHGSNSSVYNNLKKRFIWKNMWKDVSNWKTECNCPIAKGKISQHHGQFGMTSYRKPRSAYGVDHYKIKGSKEFAGVMTIVDLCTRWVKYAPVKDFSAKETIRTILKEIIYARGTPSTIVSDAAPAFVGKVINGLCKVLKIDQITTNYYPEGNSVTERNHVILGEYLRLTPKNKREKWPTDIAKLECAVNSSINATTGHTPFELECGLNPNTPADLMFVEIPSDEPKDIRNWDLKPSMYQSIIADVNKLRTIAQRYEDDTKAVQQERLNKLHGPIREFAVNDPVIVYVPVKPDDEWRSKHTIQWKFGIITERIGRTHYKVRERNGTGIYKRHVSLIQPDRSKHSQPEDLDQDNVDQIEEKKKEESEQFKAGDLVAVVEDYDKNTFEIARILEFIEDDQATVRYYGTIQKDVEKATFKPIWIDRQGRAMFRNEARADPWTGTIATEDIIVKVKLTKGDKLDAESKKLLKDRKLMYIGME